MKKGWEIKKFSDVCELVGGSQPSKDEFIYEPKDGYIRLIQVRDYRTDKFVTYIPKVKAKRFCNKEDIMIGRYGPPIFGIFKGIEGAYNVALMKAVVDERICNRDYFYLFLKTDKLREFVEHSSKRAAGQDGIRKELLDKYPVPLPPLPEQQRIVAILDEAFAAIAKAKANAQQNLQNAKELFESYLQGVFENKGKDWEEKTLGGVCSLYQGIAINAKTKHALVEKSDLPLLRIKDLKNNTAEQYIDPNNYPVNALVNESDIIYTRTGSLGLVFRGKRGVLHNNSFKVVPNAELTKDYLFIWLQNPIFKSKIMSLALKAAQPDITHAIFKVQEIAIPPIKEQKAIVLKLDKLSTETKKLESIYQQKINDLEELKKSVLQKAFNGELKTTKAIAV